MVFKKERKKLTEETKRKISEKMKGRTLTQEHKQNLSKANSFQTWQQSKPFKNNGGYFIRSFKGKQFKEHHLIYCEFYNLQKIPKGYLVYHINGDRGDNHIENLKLMPLGEHTKLHNNTQLILNPMRRYFGRNQNG